MDAMIDGNVVENLEAFLAGGGGDCRTKDGRRYGWAEAERDWRVVREETGILAGMVDWLAEMHVGDSGDTKCSVCRHYFGKESCRGRYCDEVPEEVVMAMLKARLVAWARMAAKDKLNDLQTGCVAGGERRAEG